jgi:hypothetical protein
MASNAGSRRITLPAADLLSAVFGAGAQEIARNNAPDSSDVLMCNRVVMVRAASSIISLPLCAGVTRYSGVWHIL